MARPSSLLRTSEVEGALLSAGQHHRATHSARPGQVSGDYLELTTGDDQWGWRRASRGRDDNEAMTTTATVPASPAASDRPAIVMAGSGVVTTYRELDQRSTGWPSCLRDAGLRTGDHIALMMENGSAFLEVAWAAQRSGLLLHGAQQSSSPQRGTAHSRRLWSHGVDG